MGISSVEQPNGGMALFEPVALRIGDAIRMSGLSRSELYRRAARGQVVFLKCGTSTLVDVPSLRATVAALPRAVIGPAKNDDGY